MNKILIADDDEIFRRITARQLCGMGFEVIETPDGQRVEELMATHAPVACIIDIVMPEREGTGLLFDLYERNNHRSKLIAVSGNRQYLDIVQDELADAVLQKPILPDMLKQTLSKLGVYPSVQSLGG